MFFFYVSFQKYYILKFEVFQNFSSCLFTKMLLTLFPNWDGKLILVPIESSLVEF
jgi:hypothetical protein